MFYICPVFNQKYIYGSGIKNATMLSLFLDSSHIGKAKII